jgi:hypothetical protein
MSFRAASRSVHLRQGFRVHLIKLYIWCPQPYSATSVASNAIFTVVEKKLACNIQGDNRKRQSTIREAIRLRTFVNNLTEFADAPYKACRKTHAAATWSLELWYPETHRTVKDWNHTELVDIDLHSF